MHSTQTSANVAARRPGKWGRRGFSIVEVLVATLVLTVGISGAAASIVSARALTRTNTETALAQQAARRMLEQARGMDFADVFAVLSVAPGKDFAVLGLRPLAADPHGFVGEVLFPTVAGPGGLELREDVADPAWGMPRDPDTASRLAACGVLAQLRSARAVPALIEALRRDDWALRKEARDALCALAGRDLPVDHGAWSQALLP